MKQWIDRISEEVAAAFERAGYDPALGRVTVSNRPDLCEYQCNGAMAGAKQYHKAPLVIAEEVAAQLQDSRVLETAEAVRPGFLNLKVSGEALARYMGEMDKDERLSVPKADKSRKIIVDYGGANVAKPLHVGHLRSAIIGESVKRMLQFMGHEAIGDVHLGDWGLQMGLIITEVKHRHPELPYFDPAYDGDYPQDAPFTISELEEIYPAASARSKEDEAYKEEAMQATHELQQGRRGYHALWQHILNVSVADLKRNYDSLDVHFELWKKESDAQPYIPPMVERLKAEGYAHEDQGALVVDVKEESDTKEIPPCMILKSDGSALYPTTDLATLVMRREDYDPDAVIYIVDKRQELHFVQVFRCARKTGIVREDTDLRFLGFGTMNGRDGKPFKTREGGVMRLENLIGQINEEMYRKIIENHEADPDEARETAKIVALSAIKYGDLSNQAGKDYIFDIDKFTSFEGNTGPYLLYTIVRIKSILSRYEAGKAQAGPAGTNESAVAAEPAGLSENAGASGSILSPASEDEKALMLTLAGYGASIESAADELAPHKICAYIYALANDFNRFYHETKILTCEDEARRESYITLLRLICRVLEQSIELLGFTAPDRM